MNKKAIKIIKNASKSDEERAKKIAKKIARDYGTVIKKLAAT